MYVEPNQRGPGRKDPAALLRSEDPIACVAQTRYDIAVLVEVVVERAGVDLNVRMILDEVFNAFGSGDENHELDVLAAGRGSPHR